jgi:hypothetical protein
MKTKKEKNDKMRMMLSRIKAYITRLEKELQ